MDETILTLAELKAYLNIAADDSSKDTQLGTLLAAIAPYIFDQTGVWFGSAKEFTEYHDYQSVIFVDHIPVVALTSISRDYRNEYTKAIAPTSYSVNKNTGRITLSRLYGNSSDEVNRSDYDELQVKYTSGILTVPATVKEAAKLFAASLYNANVNDGLEITSEGVGTYRKTYKVSTRERDLLSGYRVVNA